MIYNVENKVTLSILSRAAILKLRPGKLFCPAQNTFFTIAIFKELYAENGDMCYCYSVLVYNVNISIFFSKKDFFSRERESFTGAQNYRQALNK